MSIVSVLKKPQKGYFVLVSAVAFLTLCYIANEGDFLFPEYRNKFETYYDENNCGCPRVGRTLSRSEKEEGSLCSDWSTVRGKGQNVLSYSIFGGENENVFRTFYGQIEERIREIAFYYPGWSMRLYHNTSKDSDHILELLCNLYCKYPQFDLCDANSIFVPLSWKMFTDDILKNKYYASGLRDFALSVLKLFQETKLRFPDKQEDQADNSFDKASQDDPAVNRENSSSLIDSSNKASFNFSGLLVGKMWRFSVMADPYVDKFLVRDLDSFILPREVAAVTEWIENSTAPTHGMRDHPSHNGFILAGMWGGSRTRAGKTLKGLFQEILKLPLDFSSQYDQQVLKDVIWPEVGLEMLVHDSYHCQNPLLARKNVPRPFPTRRRGRMFVSWGPFRPPKELTLIGPCPLACRPKDHREWNFC